MKARVILRGPDADGRHHIRLFWWDYSSSHGRHIVRAVDHHGRLADFPAEDCETTDQAVAAVQRWAWQTKQPGAAPSDEEQGALFGGESDG